MLNRPISRTLLPVMAMLVAASCYEDSAVSPTVDQSGTDDLASPTDSLAHPLTQGGVAPPSSACATAPLRTSLATADHGFGTVHYFCSSGGVDSNNGLSPSTAKASWSAMISTFNSMPAGDTVALCRGGSWTASTGIIQNTRCSAAATCDFRDYGTGNLPLITYNGNGYIFRVFELGHEEGYRWWNIHVENVSGSEIAWIFANDVSDVDICNVNVNGGYLGVQDNGGNTGQGRNNRITVRNSTFSNTHLDAILAGSSNFTVDSNVFTNVGDSTTCPSGGMFCHAVYLGGETVGGVVMEAQDIRITNNTMTMDSSVSCGSEMIHIAGRYNHGLVENNYMLATNSTTNSCEGIQAAGSGYLNSAWLRAMTYRRNRIFLLGNPKPTQCGIALDGHGTVASDISGQSVYTLNQAVSPAIVADNIIVLGGSYPSGIAYQTNSSAASPKGDVTSGIITYNNSIYFPLAQNQGLGINISGTGGSYVVQNNAVFGPTSRCINTTQGYLSGRSTPNYCRTVGGGSDQPTNGISSDALSVVWTDAANGNFSLPVGSPLIGTGNAIYFDTYALARTQVTWTAADLPTIRALPSDIGAFSSR